MNSIFYLLFLYFVFKINAEPLVKISKGILDGTTEISKNGRKYSAFLGIRYAKAPVGNLRFQNPEASEAWIGIRPAKTFGNICPQKDGRRSVVGDEDCLFLNVFTPKLEFNSLPSDTNALLPVMFFIHGGGFILGSSNIYGAQYFLDKNVILVTINYRLGMLGFLTTGDLVAPGNFGLKDQVLALKWVQENIKSFGGDPTKVTIFGQSAGGVSVNLHAFSPASTGLFSAYIIHSGVALTPLGFQTREKSLSYLRRVSPKVLCISRNTRNLVACLRRKSVASLVNIDSGPNPLNWLPTDEMDNDDAFLTDTPKNLMNNNATKDLPFMSGAVADEGLLITQALYSNDLLYNLFKLNTNHLIDYMNRRYYETESSRRFRNEVTRFYFNGSILTSTKADYLDSLTRFIGDGLFLHPQVRMIEKVTPVNRNPNYFYNFAYRGSMSITMMDGNQANIGVDHGDDALYLFPVTINNFRITHLNFTTNDDYVSKLMIDLWTSFATNRVPVSSVLTNSNLWSPYTIQNPVHIQIGNIRNNKDPSVTLSNNYYTQRMNFWRNNAPL
ncbi:esterase FE4-like [Leptopilina heterotoma]|uniref:esterase FE4-like n=1 Tax=Leptopilina heterotoma TaxID=63436 RepID=UPI001CA8BB52|nr:esterase FE4-like [Leptopilina heterotoma]